MPRGSGSGSPSGRRSSGYKPQLPRTPSGRSSALADASLSAGFPGGRLRRVQRLREPRQQPQVCGIVVLRGVLRQEAAGRPEAPGGLPKVTHQFSENGAFFLHGPTVHPAYRRVRDRPPYGRPGPHGLRRTTLPRISVNNPSARASAIAMWHDACREELSRKGARG